jgi:hypothetical protein
MKAGPRRLGRRAALIAIAVALASLLPDASLAASRACRQLEAELASAGAGRPTARSRKQEDAITRQREQIQLAKRHARGAGCSFRLFGGSSSCGAINAKIDKMERNLAAMERRRAPAAAGRSRAKIMAALRANGCRDEVVAERRPPRGLDGARSLLDQIFGGGIRQRGPLDELGAPVGRDDSSNIRRVPPEGGWVNEGGRIRFSAPPGNYRTLCVRTCDGYYFPISNSSRPSDFDRDHSNCQASCPGTEVQIYYHRPGQESETMVSGISGQPYSELPAAFLYKRTDMASPAGCGCNRPTKDGSRNFTVIAGEEAAAPTVEPEPAYPSIRPDPASDPETQANLDGGLDAETLRRLAAAPKTDAAKPPAEKPAEERTGTPAEERKIRVVGPVFLPDPEEASDPQAPAPTEVR